MSNLLGSVDSVKEIENAFFAYDAIRRPRSQKVVTTSRGAAAIYEFEDSSVGTDLTRVKERLETWFDWIWNEDLQEQLKRAQSLLEKKSKSVTTILNILV